MAEDNLLPRHGPTVQDYLIDFFQFLRRRTGFRADHFRAPFELQRTLEQMEYHRLPLQLWNGFLNAAMRLIASMGIEFNVDTFVNIIFQVVTALVCFWLDYYILKAALYVIGFVTPSVMKSIIIFVYHLVNWAAQKLWQWIEERLQRYARLALHQLSIYYRPSIQQA